MFDAEGNSTETTGDDGSVARILVLGGKRDVRSSVAEKLKDTGHDVTTASKTDDAIILGRSGMFDLILVDRQPSDAKALHLLRVLRRESPGTALIVMAENESLETAVEATRLGARNYLTRPFGPGEVVGMIDKIATAGRPLDRDERLSESERRDREMHGVIGASRPIRDLMNLVEKVAETDSTVLIAGEVGTGKELVGGTIHKLSSRASGAFAVVNAAAFPETLLESELFGHGRGAFTGAARAKKGLFESAHRGTIFLDEVADVSLSMQAKLLRFLQTGEIRTVDGESIRGVDVRLVTATDKNLEREVAQGRFREDLYYRLAVLPLQVPPLRERADDIPLLVEHFLRRFSERAGRPVLTLDSGAMDLLMGYAWPGNVRQLKNAIESGVTVCRGSEITVDDLPAQLREVSRARPGETIQSLRMMERAHILNTLDRVGWNRKRAAELLQISTTTLWRRLKEFGVEREHKRRMLPPVAPRS